jgi:hypothetical protein
MSKMLSEKRNDLSRNPLLIAAARNLVARRQTEEARHPVMLAERVGLTPDAWQADLLKSEARQMILLCSRQAGKSTVSSLLALHAALYHPLALILLLSPSLRQSQELFRKVKDAYSALAASAVTAREESSLRMEFSNGARIVALPGKEETIRGFSGVALLIVDEASRVSDALYQAVRPMLAVSGGRIVLLSTPFGKRGFFHQEWTEGGALWHRTKVTAHDCPRIPPDWLEQERKQIGEWWYRQEYEVAFVETVDQVFRYDDIMRALDADVQPLFGGHS